MKGGGSLLYGASDSAKFTPEFIEGQALCALDRISECDMAMQKWLIWFTKELSGRRLGALGNWSEVKNIDSKISKFLHQLGDRWLTLEGLQIIEYLIRAYEINDRLAFDLFALTMPFHHQPLFIRMIQILSPEKDQLGGILPGLQKKGQPINLNDFIKLISTHTPLLVRLASFSMMVIESAPINYSRTHRIFIQRFLHQALSYGSIEMLKNQEESFIQLFNRIAIESTLNSSFYVNILKAYSARIKLNGYYVNQMLGDVLKSAEKQKEPLSPHRLADILTSIIGHQYNDLKSASLRSPALKTSQEKSECGSSSGNQAFTRHMIYEDPSEQFGIIFIPSITWEDSIEPTLDSLIKILATNLSQAHLSADLTNADQIMKTLKVFITSEILLLLETESANPPDENYDLSEIQRNWLSEGMWSKIQETPQLHVHVLNSLIDHLKVLKTQLDGRTNVGSLERILQKFIELRKPYVNCDLLITTAPNAPDQNLFARELEALKENINTMKLGELVIYLKTESSTLEACELALERILKSKFELRDHDRYAILCHIITLALDSSQICSEKLRAVIKDGLLEKLPKFSSPFTDNSKEETALHHDDGFSFNELRSSLNRISNVDSLLQEKVVLNFYAESTESSLTAAILLAESSLSLNDKVELANEALDKCLKSLSPLSLPFGCADLPSKVVKVIEKLSEILESINDGNLKLNVLRVICFLIAQIPSLEASIGQPIALKELCIEQCINAMRDQWDVTDVRASLLNFTFLDRAKKFLNKQVTEKNLWIHDTADTHSSSMVCLNLVIGCFQMFTSFREDRELLINWAKSLTEQAEKELESFTNPQCDMLVDFLGAIASHVVVGGDDSSLKLVDDKGKPKAIVKKALQHIGMERAYNTSLRQIDLLGGLVANCGINPKYVSELTHECVQRICAHNSFISDTGAQILRRHGKTLLGENIDDAVEWKSMIEHTLETRREEWTTASLSQDLMKFRARMNLEDLDHDRTIDTIMESQADKEYSATVFCVEKLLKFFLNLYPQDSADCEKVLALTLSILLLQYSELRVGETEVSPAIIDFQRLSYAILSVLSKSVELGYLLDHVARNLIVPSDAEESGTRQKARHYAYHLAIVVTQRDGTICGATPNFFKLVASRLRLFPSHRLLSSIDYPALTAVEIAKTHQFSFPIAFARSIVEPELVLGLFGFRNQRLIEQMIQSPSTTSYVQPNSATHETELRKLLNQEGETELIEWSDALKELLTNADATVHEELIVFATILIVNCPNDLPIAEEWLTILCSMKEESIKRLRISVSMIALSMGPDRMNKFSVKLLCKFLKKRIIPALRNSSETYDFDSWQCLLAIVSSIGVNLHLADDKIISEISEILLWSTNLRSKLFGTEAVTTFWQYLDCALSETKQLHFHRRCIGYAIANKLLSESGRSLENDRQSAEYHCLFASVITAMCSAEGVFEIIMSANAAKLQEYLKATNSESLPDLYNTLESLSYIIKKAPAAKIEPFQDSLLSMISLLMSYFGSLYAEKFEEQFINQVSGESALKELSPYKLFSHPELIAVAMQPDGLKEVEIGKTFTLERFTQDLALHDAGHIYLVAVESALCSVLSSMLLKMKQTGISEAITTILTASRNGADKCLGQRLSDVQEDPANRQISIKDFYLARLFTLLYRAAVTTGGVYIVGGSIWQVEDDLVNIFKVAVQHAPSSSSSTAAAAGGEASSKKRKCEINGWYWFELGTCVLSTFGQVCGIINEAEEVFKSLQQNFAVSQELMQCFVKSFTFFESLPRFPAVGSYCDVYKDDKLQRSRATELAKIWFIVTRNALVHILYIASNEKSVLAVAFDHLVELCLSTESFKVKLAVTRAIHQAWATLGYLLLPMLDDTFLIVRGVISIELPSFLLTRNTPSIISTASNRPRASVMPASSMQSISLPIP